jgi:hypothetical protein
MTVGRGSFLEELPDKIFLIDRALYGRIWAVSTTLELNPWPMFWPSGVSQYDFVECTVRFHIYFMCASFESSHHPIRNICLLKYECPQTPGFRSVLDSAHV